MTSMRMHSDSGFSFICVSTQIRLFSFSWFSYKRVLIRGINLSKSGPHVYSEDIWREFFLLYMGREIPNILLDWMFIYFYISYTNVLEKSIYKIFLVHRSDMLWMIKGYMDLDENTTFYNWVYFFVQSINYFLWIIEF